MLVSLIPNVAVGFYSASETTSFSYEVKDFNVVSHQIGIRIAVESSSPLFVQILNLSRSEIQGWVSEQYPNLDEFEQDMKTRDIEVIEQFLVTHPGRILSNITMTGSQRIDYFPYKLTNVTVLFVDPSETHGFVRIGITSVTALVSGSRVFIPSVALMVIGSPPALLWIIKNKNKLIFYKRQSPKILKFLRLS